MINRISNIRISVAVVVSVGLLALGGGLAVGQALDRTVASSAALGSGFSFQGVLETDGTPLDGECDLQFGLWDAGDEGTQIGATQVISDVTVSDGLFAVQLNEGDEFGADAFTGAARWLEIGVQCADGEGGFTTLSPRQPLTAVPYAHGLRPGASVAADAGTALSVETLASDASSLVVSGRSPNTAFPSLRVNNSGAGGYGLHVDKANGGGVASFGANNGTTGSGTAGYSANWYGLYGYTGRDDHNYGIYSPDNLFTRNVTMAGAMTIVAQNQSGQTLEAGDVAALAGIGSIESIGSSGGQPIVQVAPATAENSSAVAGVVYGRFPRELLNAPPEGLDGRSGVGVDRTAPIASGDYLLLVVYGPAQVKNTGLTASIQPGDLLTFGGTDRTGVTLASAATADGAVFGKALEASSAEKSLLYVFVTLR